MKNKKMFRRFSLILAVLMLVPMFTFSGAAVDNSVNSVPYIRHFCETIVTPEATIRTCCITYGRQTDSPKRQSSDITFTPGEELDSPIHIAYYAKARNYYIGSAAADSRDMTGYVTLGPTYPIEFTEQVVLEYDMERLDLFQKIATYYDFNIGTT